MKTHPSRRKDGFTLVELLVVIAIIAVLAGAGFAAGNAAIQRAKKTTALASCTAIEGAVNAFYSEYNSMPKEGMNTDETVKTDAAEGVTFLKVLLGAEGATATNPLNVRSIKLLSVSQGKAKKNGLIYDAAGTTVEGLFDPWGGPYNVILDGDYDEIVKPAPLGGGGATLNGKRSAAWSAGADGTKGSGKPADDVKTW
ncbi:MAG: prepilin-type N-terminal cleavage/methylation domain-containing protein [Verrucomicrobiota bacterium]